MTWTTPTHVAAGEADSAKFNDETVDNLLHIYNSGAARAYASAATSIGTSITTIALATESYDTDGNFASNTYTCPRAGFLDVRGRVSTGVAMTDGQRLFCSIYKNGAEVVRGSDVTQGGAQAGGSVASDVISVAASDAITLRAQVVGGTAKNCETGETVTFLTCRMVV